ncbi:MAG TPA: multifunctional oxoglutarate decarboxylase/oxoglutarate dehydrogenase thiamine pyrophosphate-binding subunit/dihydrolipoyllysine-residue succinyltransferase subunit [Trebonia sp.]
MGRIGVGPNLAYLMELVADPATARRVVLAADAMRTLGHLVAAVNPLPALAPPADAGQAEKLAWLRTDSFGDFADLPALLVGGPPGAECADAREALLRLRQTYLGPSGYEFGHLRDSHQREWLEEQVETLAGARLPAPDAAAVLARLARVEGFERFMQRAYVGEKRFSLEGTDMVVPMLERVIGRAYADGFETVVFGTVSRGRLNVLTQLFGGDAAQLFAGFEESSDPDDPRPAGDVKYHLGGETLLRPAAGGRPMRLVMLPNPSHLEFGGPVALGLARAIQDRGRPGLNSALPVLTHGDAAFAGQGIVPEMLNFHRLPGYSTGGTVHILMNNQIGFTTEPAEGRSTRYATDLARGFEIPVVHVNADDPDACIRAVDLAYAYRMTFGADFMIDLIGYRRRGHQEVDDPSFTQPVQSQLIEALPTVFESYSAALAARGAVPDGHAAQLEAAAAAEYRAAREAGSPSRFGEGPDSPEPPAAVLAPPAVTPGRLRELNEALLAVPGGFTPSDKLDRRVLAPRRGLDLVYWAHAEALAWASLVQDGVSVRVTGEDAERGTFAQRHAVWHDAVTGTTYCPLRHVPGARARFDIFNAPLSETATLAFEYGYSIDQAPAVTFWEAQFGDFANVAQPIVDQYIMVGGVRWGQRSSLVLLLPHGLEGQGAEHSSARPERFLQLAAERNAWIVNCTTAAQYFHVIRRHALSGERRPLIVFSPKRLLRDRAAASPAAELATGQFHPVVTRILGPAGAVPARVLLGTGRICADLAAAHATHGTGPAAVISLEQLYPLPLDEVTAAVRAFPAAAEVCWVQEEPENMGAWQFVRDPVMAALGRPVRYVGRPARAVPAQGSAAYHRVEQARVLAAALGAAP